MLLLSIVLLAGWFAEPAAAAMPEIDMRLIEAVQAGNTAQVKALLGKGARATARDEAGRRGPIT